MAIKQLDPGKVDVGLSASAKLKTKLSAVQTPPGGLYPLRLNVFELPEYRMMSGFPVAVPDCDVQSRTLVSCDGTVLSGRPLQEEVITGASVRWTSKEDTYDIATLAWTPTQGSASFQLQTAAEYAPTYVDDYEYRIGQERFFQNVLNFDADEKEHFWLDMAEINGGSLGYTVIMVGAFNSVYGNNMNQPFAGIWCPGSPTPIEDEFEEDPGDHWISVTLRGQYLYVQSEDQFPKPVLAMSSLLATSAPVYLALVLGRPYTTVYAGSGPSNVRAGAVQLGEDSYPLNSNVVLGRTTGDTLHTADLSLMDLNIYTDQLTGDQVVEEFKKLSAVYGGDL